MIDIRHESRIEWVAPRDPFENILWARYKQVDISLGEGLTTTSWDGCVILAFAIAPENIHWGESRITRVAYLRTDGPSPEGIGPSPTLPNGNCIDGDDIIGSPRMSIGSPWGYDFVRHGPSSFGRRLRKCDGEDGVLHPQTIASVTAWHRIYQDYYATRAAIDSGICDSPADDDYSANYRLAVAAETGIKWLVDPKLVQHTHHVHEVLQHTPCNQMPGMLVLGHTVTDRGVGRVFGLPCGMTGFEKNPVPTPGWRLVSPRSIAIQKPAKPPGMRWWHEKSIELRLNALHA